MSKTPVSILQEMMVKQGMIPDYELIHDGGGRHVNTFTYRVSCDGLSATGTGRCKKDAKHEAAKAMLSEIAAHKNYLQLPAANTPVASPSRSPFHSISVPPKITNVPFVNAVGELQELCVNNNLEEPQYVLIRDHGPPHAKIFTIRCKISSFEENGTATTKKQAKHDAAKKMVDKIKYLVNNDLYKEKDEEDSSNSVTTDSIDMMTKCAEEYYRTSSKMTKKLNLGIRLADYHIKWRDSLETDKRNKILEELESIFPNEMYNNLDEYNNESIVEKIAKFEATLAEVDVTVNMKDIVTDNHVMQLIELNTCPILTQIGIGHNELEASWKALSLIIQTLKLLLM
ncbi:hypothetical protein P5V15_004615 [Pogonomyrmex californicus]